MIHVLYFSDRDVKQKLFARAGAAEQLTLVTAVRHGKHMKPVPEREPFASLKRELGERLDMVVVADEGTVEGMWRDPVGDLADALYPNDKRQAYAAASGYMLLERGRVLAVVRKRNPEADVYWVRLQVAKLLPGVPPPEPPERADLPRDTELDADTETEERPTDESESRQSEPRHAEKDPFAVLGIRRDASLAEARRAYHQLIAQYHPDKVAHLAPEFRELAETRTRQILEAWQKVEVALRDTRH